MHVLFHAFFVFRGGERVVEAGVVSVGSKRWSTWRRVETSCTCEAKADDPDADSADQPVISFDFAWQLRAARGNIVPHPDTPPYLTITPMQGSAMQDKETLITITYTPCETHRLDGLHLVMMLPGGLRGEESLCCAGALLV